jgi:NAD+ kinase
MPDVLVSLGGDGTILRIVSFCAANDIPILGLNLGTVGFLTGLEANETDKLTDILTSKKYGIERRAMLEIETESRSLKSFALNEVVLRRQDSSGLVSLEVSVNGEFVDRYYSDGFIVATPTGSTAYSLSAGGPIITPNAGVLALTPINPHTLHSRPIIISGSDRVSLVPKEACLIVADGKTAGAAAGGEAVGVTLSSVKAKFIKTDNAGFFERLLNKLNKWSTT